MSLKVSMLTPNAKNPRTITEESKDRLGKSLKNLGDLSGIVWNRRSKRLVAGHQRVSVLPPETKIELIKSYKKPNEQGTVAVGFIEAYGERFSYRCVDWDPETEMIGMIRANKEAGQWNMEMLAEDFQMLEKKEANFDDTGFSYEEISRIMTPAGQHNDIDSKSTNDLTNQWDQSTIRQMVIVLGKDDFAEAMSLIDEVKKSNKKLETTTDVFMYLLKDWKTRAKN